MQLLYNFLPNYLPSVSLYKYTEILFLPISFIKGTYNIYIVSHLIAFTQAGSLGILFYVSIWRVFHFPL